VFEYLDGEARTPVVRFLPQTNVSIESYSRQSSSENVLRNKKALKFNNVPKTSASYVALGKRDGGGGGGGSSCFLSLSPPSRQWSRTKSVMKPSVISKTLYFVLPFWCRMLHLSSVSRFTDSKAVKGSCKQVLCSPNWVAACHIHRYGDVQSPGCGGDHTCTAHTASHSTSVLMMEAETVSETLHSILYLWSPKTALLHSFTVIWLTDGQTD